MYVSIFFFFLELQTVQNTDNWQTIRLTFYGEIFIRDRETYLRVYIQLMKLRGKTIRSWCDGSSDRSFMGCTHWAISRSS